LLLLPAVSLPLPLLELLPPLAEPESDGGSFYRNPDRALYFHLQKEPEHGKY
jgi:hypothetical protein